MYGGVPRQEVDQTKLVDRLWKKNCQAHKLNREDAMCHGSQKMEKADRDD